MSGSNETSYVHNLAQDVVRRVRFVIRRGRILEFVVQVECFIQDEWHVIVRYDTAHGFVHRDVLLPDGSQIKTELEFSDYNKAFTFAQFDTKTNWQTYREQYERQLRK